MTQQHELTAETPPSLAMHGRSYTVARLLSQVLHPLVTTTLNFFIIGFFALPERWVGIGWAILIIAMQVVPPMVVYLIRLHQGAYSDEEVSVREQRNELYIFSLVVITLAIVFLAFVHVPRPFLALLGGGLVLNLLSWIINLYWKISVHAATAAMCATTATIYAPSLGVVLWVGAFAVGWSRIRTRNHTPLQVLAGLSLAACVTVSAFAFLGLL